MKVKSAKGNLRVEYSLDFFDSMPCSLCLENMAGSTGLEPAASAVTGQRSNQLNYDPAFICLGLAETPVNTGDPAPMATADRASTVPSQPPFPAPSESTPSAGFCPELIGLARSGALVES